MRKVENIGPAVAGSAGPVPPAMCYSLTCKTLVLYYSGPLMYVYVCIQMRCFITTGREGGEEREGNNEERKERSSREGRK